MKKSVYIAIINVMFLYAGVMMTNTSVEAVAPPDSCFAFSAGTIVEYYDNESGDSSNPACPRDVDIPDSIGGEPVTAIDDIAFYDKQLTSVTISDSVISIGDGSFADNNLTSIVIGDSVDIIKDEAFWGNKLDTIVVQGSPTTVGEGIFSNNLVPIRSISYNDVVYEAPTGQHDIPEECLWFEDGTIYEYYYGDIRTIRDHGVSCLATDIRIPGEIDSQEVHSILNERIVDETLAVPTGGFGNMHLSSVVIPDSVRTIGGRSSYLSGGVFAHNSMTSLTLGSSVERIDGQAFAGNRLTQVSIPLSVVYVSNDSFAYWSMSREEVRLLEDHSYTGYDLPADEILTSIQYVGLVTPDGANPNDLSHGVKGVCLEYNEVTWECNNTMNVGGHLINPAQLTVNYHNDVGSALLPSDTFTGQLGDDSYTTDYRVSRVAIPFPDISDYLTQEQQDANNSALNSVFFMRSSSVEIAPPSIGGYITPSVQTFSLVDFNNQGTYVYNTLVSNDDEGGANADDDGDTTELADTGLSSTIILATSLLTVLTGCALLTLGLRRRKQL